MKTFLANFKWKHVGVLIGLLLVVALLLDFERRLDDLHRLSQQLERVRVTATAVMKTQVALLTQVAYATSEEAVEQWAYQEGRWRRQGEHLVILVPNSTTTPTPPVSSASSLPPLPKWRIWWELFFGSRP